MPTRTAPPESSRPSRDFSAWRRLTAGFRPSRSTGDGVAPNEAARRLGDRGLAVWHGNYYAPPHAIQIETERQRYRNDPYHRRDLGRGHAQAASHERAVVDARLCLAFVCRPSRSRPVDRSSRGCCRRLPHRRNGWSLVPELLFGADFVSAVCRRTAQPVEVHLMVDEADRWIERFAKTGCAWIAIHLASSENAEVSLREIERQGARPVITLTLAERRKTSSPTWSSSTEFW